MDALGCGRFVTGVSQRMMCDVLRLPGGESSQHSITEGAQVLRLQACARRLQKVVRCAPSIALIIKFSTIAQGIYFCEAGFSFLCCNGVHK